MILLFLPFVLSIKSSTTNYNIYSFNSFSSFKYSNNSNITTGSGQIVIANLTDNQTIKLLGIYYMNKTLIPTIIILPPGAGGGATGFVKLGEMGWINNSN